MKKIKLLLLWWLFTLVWMFNYSSADYQASDCASVEKVYNQNVCVLPNWIKWISCEWTFSWYAKRKNWNFAFAFYDKPCNLTINQLCDSSNLDCGTNWDNLEWIWYLYSDYENTSTRLFYILPWIAWLTSWLSSTVSSLTNTINEFIPYLVYITLGVLGVIFWFYAIKWLLRFVKWSSLFVFSSRKKK